MIDPMMLMMADHRNRSEKGYMTFNRMIDGKHLTILCKVSGAVFVATAKFNKRNLTATKASLEAVLEEVVRMAKNPN